MTVPDHTDTDPDPDPTPVVSPEPDPKPDEVAAKPDIEAELAKWKEMARKNEAQAKENADAAKKLAEIEMAGKSETERLQIALEQAQTEARTATIQALKLKVAAEKELPSRLAKFLPDLDNEIDMLTAADELLEAAGEKKVDPVSQPRSTLTSPLSDGDPSKQSDAVLAAMLGQRQ